MKKHIPNFITCLNLLCGCIAIPYAFLGVEYAAYLVFLAAFFDLMDGMAARLLHVHSAIGKELDSLADVVSFGVVPGFMMCSMLSNCHLGEPFEKIRIIQFIPLIIPVFSALRLAKFNVDTRQTTSFIGLPTPANSLLISSLFLIYSGDNPAWNAFIGNEYFILITSIVLSLLLVSEIPMFSLKMKSFSFGDNKIQYIFLALSALLLGVFFLKAMPLIIILYILLSIINNVFIKAKA